MPHLREENAYWRLPEFLKFTGKTEYRILKFLLAHIVRDIQGYNAPSGAVRIYRNFFKKKMLCASYSQNNIAKYFGFVKKDGKPNGGYVSRLIKKLESMQFLKIHKIPTPAGQRNVYELGYYEGTYGKDGYQEHLFFDLYFGAKIKMYRLETEKRSRLKVIERNTPGFVDELECKIYDLEKEISGLTDRTVDSFK